MEKRILGDINKLISYLEGIITSGSCSNFEEYRYSSGRLAAFRECIKIIKGHSENE
jgi:hypothetical protein